MYYILDPRHKRGQLYSSINNTIKFPQERYPTRKVWYHHIWFSSFFSARGSHIGSPPTPPPTSSLHICLHAYVRTYRGLLLIHPFLPSQHLEFISTIFKRQRRKNYVYMFIYNHPYHTLNMHGAWKYKQIRQTNRSGYTNNPPKYWLDMPINVYDNTQ